MIPLSIIIPVWNRELQVCDTLRSIASQEGIDRCRIILVDNASTDGTRKVLSRWIEDNPSVNSTLTDCHIKGAAAARNAGIALVDTPWTLQFDSDDIMRPGLIKSILTVIDSDNDSNLITWDVEIHPVNAGAAVRKGLHQGDDMLFQNIVHAAMATQRYAAKTQLLRQAGLWNETCMGWNDMEFGTRILRQNVRVRNLGKTMVDVIHCDNSITEPQFSKSPAKWEHALDLMSETMSDSPRALKWIDYRRIILAAFYAREGDKDNASRLYRATLAGKSLSMRMPLALCYFKHRIYPRASYLLASVFFSRRF